MNFLKKMFKRTKSDKQKTNNDYIDPNTRKYY